MKPAQSVTVLNQFKHGEWLWLFYFSTVAFVPYKEDKLESDMLKDVSHADVAKDDEIIDDTDPNYDDYYDVSVTYDVSSFIL